ncbi:OPT/YSL family transporter [Leucobacter insecticola]|uniref:OPT/YSL family transporter n=1 Tax=Leucobacter insecticola TaxID=2714934 RepID=UPI001981A9DB|nr:OPT/YSL family transporter [Leucobacter insecticola]
MTELTQTESEAEAPKRHPRSFEPGMFVLLLLLSGLGVVIGIHVITTLGVSPSTSVIGALIAMIIGRIGFFGLSRMRNIHRQNLAQSAISAGTFGAANSILTPIAIPFALGRPDMIWPMFIGASVGLILDAWMLYRVFGSEFIPATATWPSGRASAETIKAGDVGGKQALLLGFGAVVGIGGSIAGLSMSAAGVALIGNIWALLMFGIGLLLNQYFPILFDVSLLGLYIPHGVMIGAGTVALVQAGRLIFRKRTTSVLDTVITEVDPDPSLIPTVNQKALRRAFGTGYLLFVGGAMVLGLAAGLWTEMSMLGIIGWVLLAGVAAIVHEIIVGLAAMHSGWFPAFAVALIFLVIGMFLGLPDVPLMLLVGYCAVTGPAFSDMGDDLKAGWVLRRRAWPYTVFELQGRREQLKAAFIGFATAIGVVAIAWQPLFANNQFPPIARVYADTILAGISDPTILRNMFLAAIPGAIIQIIGGSKRQMGVLLATGLLISAPMRAGWSSPR